MLTTEIYFQTPEVGNRECEEVIWFDVLIPPSARIFRSFPGATGRIAQYAIDFPQSDDFKFRTRLSMFAASFGRMRVSLAAPLLPSTDDKQTIEIYTDEPNV